MGVIQILKDFWSNDLRWLCTPFPGIPSWMRSHHRAGLAGHSLEPSVPRPFTEKAFDWNQERGP